MQNVFNYQNIKDQLDAYVGEWATDYDLDAVMDELRDNNVQSLDDIDIDSILMKWDKTE